MKKHIRTWIVRKWILIIVFSTSGNIVIAHTTTLNYTIAVDGVNVGNMQAIQKIDGNKKTITINSSTKIHFLGTTEITTSLVTVIRDGLLESSDYNSKKDGKLYENTIVTESEGVYHINQQRKGNTITSSIKQATCELYFEEPNPHKPYFDVTTGVLNPVEKIGLNTYTYNDRGNKRKTTYEYSNSKLLSGTTRYTWYKFSFTRKN